MKAFLIGTALAGGLLLGACGADDGGTSVRIDAVDIDFDQATYEVDAGVSRIDFRNRGVLPHNIVFRDVNGAPTASGETEFLLAGQTQSFEVELAAGEYEFYCSVPGHEEAGMISILVVG